MSDSFICSSSLAKQAYSVDRIQSMHRYLVGSATGTPEGIGKADYLSTLINQITSGLGATVGLAQMIARAMNVRARRLEALHDVSVLWTLRVS